MHRRKISITFFVFFLGLMACVAGCQKKGPVDLRDMTLEDGESEETKKAEKEEKKEKAISETAVVHVCGAVQKPGVYELKGGSRIYEAILLAGGLTEEGAGEYLNQAQAVLDGERIYVPTKAEVESGAVPSNAVAGAAEAQGDGQKVNINTASKEELMTLTGIGEAKASSIIAYRESNGAFKKVEELMQIEGIKEGVFNKVKDKIMV